MCRKLNSLHTLTLIRLWVTVGVVSDGAKLRRCVTVEVAVLGSPSLIVRDMVSADVTQHLKKKGVSQHS